MAAFWTQRSAGPRGWRIMPQPAWSGLAWLLMLIAALSLSVAAHDTAEQ